MKRQDWRVPISVKDRYWAGALLMEGYEKAADAEQAAKVLCDELPVVLAGKGTVVVGKASIVGEPEPVATVEGAKADPPADRWLDVRTCPWCGNAAAVGAHGHNVCDRTDGVVAR
jgi:hypothetical protein